MPWLKSIGPVNRKMMLRFVAYCRTYHWKGEYTEVVKYFARNRMPVRLEGYARKNPPIRRGAEYGDAALRFVDEIEEDEEPLPSDEEIFDQCIIQSILSEL